jgi:hypothetical protein
MGAKQAQSLRWEISSPAELVAIGREAPGTDCAYQGSKVPSKGVSNVRFAPLDDLLSETGLSQFLHASTQLLLLSTQPTLL